MYNIPEQYEYAGIKLPQNEIEKIQWTKDVHAAIDKHVQSNQKQLAFIRSEPLNSD